MKLFLFLILTTALTGCATDPSGGKPRYTIDYYDENGMPVYREERRDQGADIKRSAAVILEVMSAAVRDAAWRLRYGVHRHSPYSHRGHHPTLPPNYREYGECWKDRRGGTRCR